MGRSGRRRRGFLVVVCFDRDKKGRRREEQHCNRHRMRGGVARVWHREGAGGSLHLPRAYFFSCLQHYSPHYRALCPLHRRFLRFLRGLTLVTGDSGTMKLLPSCKTTAPMVKSTCEAAAATAAASTTQLLNPKETTAQKGKHGELISSFITMTNEMLSPTTSARQLPNQKNNTLTNFLRPCPEYSAV